MARAWKKSATPDTEQQDIEQPKAVSLDVLEQALETTQSKLKIAAMGKKELLRTFAADPVGTTVSIRELDEEIANLTIHEEAIRFAIEEAEQAAAIAREQAKIEASRKNREAGIMHSKAAVLLAARADAAFSVYLNALEALRSNGDKCIEHFEGALVELHGDTDRLMDTVAIVAPRASSNGADMAVAVAHQFQQVIDVMGSSSLENWVLINRHVPRNVRSLKHAAEMDATFLVERFS